MLRARICYRNVSQVQYIPDITIANKKRETWPADVRANRGPRERNTTHLQAVSRKATVSAAGHSADNAFVRCLYESWYL